MKTVLAAAIAITGVALAHAQQGALVCAPSALNLVVRSEGLAETVGDITLDCSGAPGPVAGTLAVSLPVNVTNRLGANGAPDVRLTVDTGSGPSEVGTPAAGANTVTFDGIVFTVPGSGKATVRISNLRAAINQLGMNYTGAIQATLSAAGFLLSNRDPLNVATPQPGLLVSLSDATISCTGSPLPEPMSFAAALAAGTRFASFRVTENYFTAFQKKTAQDDTGTRILARFRGIPKGMRLFVPAAVAGSTALQPTSALDTPSGGRYEVTPNGSLLLALVQNADAHGAGGTLGFDVTTLPPAPVTLDALAELPVAADGSAIAAYEVVDASAAVETAQIPVFIGMGPTGGISAKVDVSVTFGPLSSDATASSAAPVPRFADEQPQAPASSEPATPAMRALPRATGGRQVRPPAGPRGFDR